MRKIGPADLAIFLAIAQHRSFRKAAVELGVTASALSHALRSIEERLEIRLVNRTTRSVALTDAGQQLFSRVSPAFLDIEDALEDLNAFRGQPSGKLRINAARVAAKLVLLPIISKFLQAYPAVEVELLVNDALVDMVAEGCDAGVRFGEMVAADMIAVPIGPRHRFAVVASPGYFVQHPEPVTPHDLSRQPCIRYRFAGGSFYRWEFEKGGIELEIEVAGPLTLGDQDLMTGAALDGAGLAYLFEEQVQTLVAEGRLQRVLEDWCPYYPGFFLYYPSRRPASDSDAGFRRFSQGKPVSQTAHLVCRVQQARRQQYATDGGLYELRIIAPGRDDLISVSFKTFNPRPSLLPVPMQTGWYRGSNSVMSEIVSDSVKIFC